MTKTVQIWTVIRMAAVLCAVCTLASPAGCLRENMDGCCYESLLYITVETESADFEETLNGATVYLFDKDGAYYASIWVDAADLAANTPIPIHYSRTNLPSAVVWANAGDATLVSDPAVGAAVEELFVSMAESADGYGVSADPLFFGGKRLEGAAAEQIVITPKTGRISVTARGVAAGDPEDEYYFTASAPYDRYDFSGEPIRGQITLNLPAGWRGTDLVTPGASHLFHFPSPPPQGESLTMRLYRIGAGTTDAELLAEATAGIDGQPIVIQRERTTNVLINIEPTGGIAVQVAITGWDEIYQWEAW